MSGADDPQAWLVNRRADLVYTHDLGRLLECCRLAGIPMPHLADDCDRLTPYAVALRYPGAGPKVEEMEARNVVAIARRILEEISRLL